MKATLIKILLTLFLVTNAVYSFDTIRGAGSSHKSTPKKEKTFLEKVDFWYLDLIGKTQDKPTNVQSTDVIIINSDRSVTINGYKLKLGSNVDEWLRVLGDNYRMIYDEAFIWDDLGISISLKRSYTGEVLKERVVKQISIQLITYNEMFPDDQNISREKMGGVKEFYFKGLIQIEDGYLSRETSFDQFQKSKVGRMKFENTFSRRSTYTMGYKNKEKLYYQIISINLTHKRFIKRISIY